MKALVVDDSKMVRLVQQRALESLGWEVKQAANGEEGLSTLQQMGEVQLVLADWQMPVMDGLAMVKRIRADARFANTVIIMVSSNASTRWGSCSSRSGIRLHWRLIHLPLGLIDYVVAHEVAHLVEMNHSPRFWSVVESLYPEHMAARKALRQAASSLPHI